MTEIECLLHQFEAATVSLADFHHREHLTVAICYASRYPPHEALARIRTGLQRVLAANGKPPSAYREDLTALWMRRAYHFLGDGTPLLSPKIIAQWLSHAAALQSVSADELRNGHLTLLD